MTWKECSLWLVFTALYLLVYYELVVMFGVD